MCFSGDPVEVRDQFTWWFVQTRAFFSQLRPHFAHTFSCFPSHAVCGWHTQCTKFPSWAAFLPRTSQLSTEQITQFTSRLPEPFQPSDNCSNVSQTLLSRMRSHPTGKNCGSKSEADQWWPGGFVFFFEGKFSLWIGVYHSSIFQAPEEEQHILTYGQLLRVILQLATIHPPDAVYVLPTILEACFWFSPHSLYI